MKLKTSRTKLPSTWFLLEVKIQYNFQWVHLIKTSSTINHLFLLNNLILFDLVILIKVLLFIHFKLPMTRFIHRPHHLKWKRYLIQYLKSIRIICFLLNALFNFKIKRFFLFKINIFNQLISNKWSVTLTGNR